MISLVAMTANFPMHVTPQLSRRNTVSSGPLWSGEVDVAVSRTRRRLHNHDMQGFEHQMAQRHYGRLRRPCHPG